MQTDVTCRESRATRRIQSSVSSIVDQRPRAEAAGDHQEVDARRVGEPVLRHDAQPAGSDHRRGRLRHGERAEGRAFVGAQRLAPRIDARAREHLEGSGEVEHLDLVEDQDADVPGLVLHACEV